MRVVGRDVVDYTMRGGVKVIADGHLLRVKGMRRGGLAGDPRDPVVLVTVLQGGEELRREAQLVALDPKDRCWGVRGRLSRGTGERARCLPRGGRRARSCSQVLRISKRCVRLVSPTPARPTPRSTS